MSTKMSRREMLRLAGALGAGIGATSLVAGCSSDEPAAQNTEEPEEAFTGLTVYDPSGPYEITQMFAERLDGLDGKTIAFISNDSWEYDRTFPVIREYLESHYQNVTILDYTEFAHGYNEIADADKSNLGADCLEKGVDGAIVGNAG